MDWVPGTSLDSRDVGRVATHLLLLMLSRPGDSIPRPIVVLGEDGLPFTIDDSVWATEPEVLPFPDCSVTDTTEGWAAVKEMMERRRKPDTRMTAVGDEIVISEDVTEAEGSVYRSPAILLRRVPNWSVIDVFQGGK